MVPIQRVLHSVGARFVPFAPPVPEWPEELAAARRFAGHCVNLAPDAPAPA